MPITLLTAARFRWGLGVAALGVLAAFPPFGTLAFDLWAERTGRLSAKQADPPSSRHGQRSSK